MYTCKSKIILKDFINVHYVQLHVDNIHECTCILHVQDYMFLTVEIVPLALCPLLTLSWICRRVIRT